MKKGHDKLFTIVLEKGMFRDQMYMLTVTEYKLGVNLDNYVKGIDAEGEEMTITDMSNCITIIDFSKTSHDWLNLKQMLLNPDGRTLAFEILEQDKAILFKGELYFKMIEKLNENTQN